MATDAERDADILPMIPNSFVAPVVRTLFSSVHVDVLSVGIQLCLCTYGLYAYKSNSTSQKRTQRPYMILSFVMLALAILATVINSYIFSEMAINSSGEWMNWLADYQRNRRWEATLGYLTTVLIVGLGDAILIGRCFVIWTGHPFQKVIVAALLLLYIGSLTVGVIMVVSEGNARIPSRITMRLSTAWTSLAVTLNVLTTSLIVMRLLSQRKRLEKLLGPGHGAKYAGPMAILVESALPFMVLGILSLAFHTLYNEEMWALNAATVSRGLWLNSAALSAQFIIFRVALGRAYTKDLSRAGSQQLSELKFSPPNQGASGSESHSSDASTEA